MDAEGVPRAEIARRLGVSRGTVASHGDMEDMSLAAPVPAERGRRALEGHAEWAASVLEADLCAPHKQRHTVRRLHDRLDEGRCRAGSYSIVQTRRRTRPDPDVPKGLDCLRGRQVHE